MQEQKRYISKNITSILKKHWILILGSIIITTLISIFVTFFLLTPQYQSSSDLLVNRKSTNDPVGQYNQVQTDLQLINTYKDIINKPVILNAVKDSLQKDYGYRTTIDKLKDSITVSSNSDSQVFTVTATDDNAIMAAGIANEVAKQFKNRIGKLMSVDNVSIVARAEKNNGAIFPIPKLFIPIGVVAGLFLGIILSLLIEYFDKTVKDEDFLLERAGLNNLGVIFKLSQEELTKNSLQHNITSLEKHSRLGRNS